MRILVTGNLGYVGPSVMRRLRAAYPEVELVGLDMGYFAHCLTGPGVLPEAVLDVQHYGDVRSLPPGLLEGVDAVVHLAAISNDPMGNAFEEVTLEINHRATVELAWQAKVAGASRFVFASSCSLYGVAGEEARTESSPLNPLTAYARSKVMAERDLAGLADASFRVTCLRYATACGMSPRLRLDLVLNDFVACALASGRIVVLSDGTPWRPLIHVDDMALAALWALERGESGGDYLAVNVGSDGWNYRVADLAAAVARLLPGVTVEINRDARPDKRSYRVDFGLYRSLAPDHQPQVDLETAVSDLAEGLRGMGFSDPRFRESHLMRLRTLTHLRDRGLLTDRLTWAPTHRLARERVTI